MGIHNFLNYVSQQDGELLSGSGGKGPGPESGSGGGTLTRISSTNVFAAASIYQLVSSLTKEARIESIPQYSLLQRF